MNSQTAFVIMQIGNPDLDELFNSAIRPAIESCGLTAKRVDKHNEGGLLKSEIVRFIETATIVVAELTNERPNVYLEIGYAMGLDKFRNLILTVREDHFPDSLNHQRGGPRVHFDLAGYDILRWNPLDIGGFRQELERRIHRRLAVISTPEVLTQPLPALDPEWIDQQRKAASTGLSKIAGSGFMEVVASLTPPKPTKTLFELNDAAQKAPIHTFGWPIAMYFRKETLKPKPRADGIVATIEGTIKESFDYWAIRRNGDFYFIGSLFEDERRPGTLFFDTRVVRVTEALLYLLRLYGFLETPREQEAVIQIRHGGLRGRHIAAASSNRHVFANSEATEDESTAEIRDALDGLEANLTSHVRGVVEPLFALFDFMRFEPAEIDDIANRFVKGEIR